MSESRFKIFIIIAVILVGCGVGLGYYFNKQGLVPTEKIQPEVVASEVELNNYKVPVNLTDSVKPKLEADLKKYQEMVAKSDTGGEKNMMRVFLALGQTYEYFGELGQARQAYLKASEQEPGSSIPIVNLGVLYESMKRDDLASAMYNKAVTMEPNWLRTWQALIEFNINKLSASADKIKSLYQQGLLATGQDLVLRKSYAAYLESVGEKINALAEWQAIGKIYPDDTAVKEEILRLSK